MDHFEEVAAKHAKPGKRARFVRERKLDELAHIGGCEVVKDDAGNPVKVRGMVLVHVSAEEQPVDQSTEE